MIIRSILDTDLYKFSMMNAVLKLYPNEIVRYDFFNRDNRPFPKGFATELKRTVADMVHLALAPEEKDFMQRNLYFLPHSYLDFLSGYRFNPDEVFIKQVGTKLQIAIEGLWYRTILWEVPLMALISELYFAMTNQDIYPANVIDKNNVTKAENFSKTGIRYCDMGTRRRYSFENQARAVTTFQGVAQDVFFGTSNVYLAMKRNLKAIGTQAHEWTQFHAAKYGFLMANTMAMESWVNVYQGELGYALTDTYTTDVFFRDFTTKYAKLFDAVRQDSGDPISFVDKAVAHYEKLKIDPMSKTAVFSDSLNFLKAKNIHSYCRDRIKDSFGIGTWISNDVGVKPLNIVIKLTGWKNGDVWAPTIKLSDDVGKNTGNKAMISLCKKTLNIK